MFQLTDGTLGLGSQLFQSHPDQECIADVIVLNPRLATLAAFEPRNPLTLAVQLLGLPTKATRLLCSLCSILSGIVGHGPVRAVGKHLNPEQAHLVVFGKALNFNSLTMGQLVGAPGQRIDTSVGVLAAGIIHLAVVFQRTIVNFLRRLDKPHRSLGGVPGIHQHRPKRQPLLAHNSAEQAP